MATPSLPLVDAMLRHTQSLSDIPLQQAQVEPFPPQVVCEGFEHFRIVPVDRDCEAHPDCVALAI